MKVLIVHPGPQFSVADVYTGLAKGLKANGVEVATLNLDDRLTFYASSAIKKNGRYRKALSEDAAIMMAAKGIEVVCYEWWPDVVILVSGFFIPPQVLVTLARRPHHVVLWGTESPYEDDRQMRVAQVVDTVILNDPLNLEHFRQVNPRTWYMPHSYDPDVHHPGASVPELACDFGFVGTGFPSRIDFFEDVDWSGLEVKIGGHWQRLAADSPLHKYLIHDIKQCMDNTDAADLYRSAAVGANLYRKEHTEDATADGWAMGPREVELAACGSFFLRESRPEGDELFPMLPTFDGPDEFGDQLRWWLAHPDLRETAAEAAHAAIVDRTFTNTAAQLLRLVDGAGKKLAA